MADEKIWIPCDDNPFDTIDEINKIILPKFGYHFVIDNCEHDGYEVFELVPFGPSHA